MSVQGTALRLETDGTSAFPESAACRCRLLLAGRIALGMVSILD